MDKKFRDIHRLMGRDHDMAQRKQAMELKEMRLELEADLLNDLHGEDSDEAQSAINRLVEFQDRLDEREQQRFERRTFQSERLDTVVVYMEVGTRKRKNENGEWVNFPIYAELVFPIDSNQHRLVETNNNQSND